MTTMPEVVTHRYDPIRGACRNVCSLPDPEASQVLDGLRRAARPTLKLDYLARRRTTENWLVEAASEALRRPIETLPVYFFLGNFSDFADRSRPAALVVPLSSLPSDAITFTLGDSMSVAREHVPRVYRLEDMIDFFSDGEAVAGFSFRDKAGFQTRFVEVQAWAQVPLCSNQDHPATCPEG
jgi:hypothetical protein